MSDHSLATVQAVAPKLNELGAAFYFTPQTLGRGAELGMKNGYAWYVVGRGGVLGDVDAEVIQSAFAYFEPKLLRKLWDQGRSALPPRQASREYAECCRAWGRSAFANAKDAGKFADLAERVIAGMDSAGLALFAGWKPESFGEADDPAGRAAMACNVLRELRFSAHVVAVVAVGLTTKEAHFTAGGDERWKLFGYNDQPPPRPRKALHAKAERLTDHIEANAYDVLTEREAATFIKLVNQLYKGGGPGLLGSFPVRRVVAPQ